MASLQSTFDNRCLSVLPYCFLVLMDPLQKKKINTASNNVHTDVEIITPDYLRNTCTLCGITLT